SVLATVEEHGLIGGLGSAVAEWLMAADIRTTRLLRFGVGDEFLHEAGETEHAREHFGLTASHLQARISQALS
ncbi:MAG: transketolase, partial [Alphaproteobacteria bacterium]